MVHAGWKLSPKFWGIALNALRKIIAALFIAALFAGIFVVSIFASIAVLAIGIVLMVLVKFNRPGNVKQTRRTDTTVIEGEYSVVDQTEKQIK